MLNLNKMLVTTNVQLVNEQKLAHFLPNLGRILVGLIFNGRNPLDVNAGRIQPGFAENDELWKNSFTTSVCQSNLNDKLFLNPTIALVEKRQI